MINDKLLKDLEYLEGPFGKAVLIKGDRGGWTQGGISSASFPHLASALAKGSVPRATIEQIYLDEYIGKIAGANDLAIKCPWLLALLTYGKVHGSGDEHYSLVIQQFLTSKGFKLSVDGIWGPKTARAVLSLDSSTLAELWLYINSRKEELKDRRSASVGIADLDKAIAERVSREFRLASALKAPSLPGRTIVAFKQRERGPVEVSGNESKGSGQSMKKVVIDDLMFFIAQD